MKVINTTEFVMYLIPHGEHNVCCAQKSSVQNYFSLITMVLYQVSLILSLQIFKIFLTE